VRLALIRGALFAPAVAFVTQQPALFVCAWVPALFALLEPWAAHRARSRWAFVLTIVAFMIGSVGLVAAHFQSVYVKALFESRSLSTAYAQLAAAPRQSLTAFGKGFPECVYVVWMAQSGGLALSLSSMARLRPAAAATGSLVIVVLFPLLDWLTLAALTDHWPVQPSAPIVLFALISSVYLIAGTLGAILGLELLRAVAGAIDRRLAPR
jgi:hypothetical protein